MIKKTVCFSAAVLSIMASSAFALDPFSTAPAPVQSFHSTQTHADSVAASAPAQPADAPTVTTAALDSGAAIIPAATSRSAVAVNSVDTENQIQNLVQSNQAMGSAIRAINQNLSVLQQQVEGLQSAHSSNSTPWAIQFIQNPDSIAILSFGGASILLLGAGMLIGRKTGRKSRLPSAGGASSKRVLADVLDDDTKSEYDFMSSDEAIPAKLDLARAYIAMNDEEQARMVLKAVIEKGDQAQRAEALSLIQSMLNKS